MRLSAAIVILSLAGFLSACGANEPLRVVQIQIGRALNADSTVSAPAYTFKPHDTIYLSVMTAGKGTGTVGVKWTYGL